MVLVSLKGELTFVSQNIVLIFSLVLELSRTHMQDLQEVTQDLHYENFRSERLKQGGRLSSHGYILPLSPSYVPVIYLLTVSPSENINRSIWYTTTCPQFLKGGNADNVQYTDPGSPLQ